MNNNLKIFSRTPKKAIHLFGGCIEGVRLLSKGVEPIIRLNPNRRLPSAGSRYHKASIINASFGERSRRSILQPSAQVLSGETCLIIPYESLASGSEAESATRCTTNESTRGAVNNRVRVVVMASSPWSQAIQRRASCWAISGVTPLPQKQSSTRSCSSDEARMMRSISAAGFCVA